jgi:hypothetical protein
MARIRLRRYEAREGDLPDVCMRCGADATTTRVKGFSWHPGWVNLLILAGLLPWAIVAIVLTKRMRVRAPLCAHHRNHWLWRAWVIYGGLAAAVLLGIGAIVLVAALSNQRGRGRGDDLAGLICVSVAGVGLAWLVTAAVVQMTGIRPTEITDRSITLTGVSPEFVDAVREERQRRDDEEEDFRRRPRRRRPPREQDDVDDLDVYRDRDRLRDRYEDDER